MANADMILLKLENTFGKSPLLNIDIAAKMKEQILKNAVENRKEEYNSKVGLALLFDQAGGKMTPDMVEAVESDMKTSAYVDTLIEEIKAEWDEWDGSYGERDNKLSFNHFYNGFMAPYFATAVRTVKKAYNVWIWIVMEELIGMSLNSILNGLEESTKTLRQQESFLIKHSGRDLFLQ